MKMKKLFAAVAATAMAATSLATMSFSASAALTTIPYTGPSAGALGKNDDGSTLRLNILNTWGNNFTDIDGNVTVEDNITVNFTISGIGTDSHVTNTDGSEGDAYFAALVGTIGTNNSWKDTDPAFAPVAINGDGTYTVTWELEEGSESIECLILTTNINVYNYSDQGDTSVLPITINSITTGKDDEPVTDAPVVTTEATAGADDTQTTTTVAVNADVEATTTAAGGAAVTTAKGATTTAKGATTAKSAATTTSANTGVAGVGIAFAALTVAGAAAFVSRKK